MLDFVTYKMKILITSATSKLSQQLTTDLSADHQIRLTDLVDFETDFDFVQSDLGHESETDELVKDIDTIIHLATLPLDRFPDTLYLQLAVRCRGPEHLEFCFCQYPSTFC